MPSADDEAVFFSRVIGQQFLELLVASRPHGFGEFVAEGGGQVAGKCGDIAIRQKRFEQVAALAVHFLIDALEAFDQTAGVVGAVAVVPDIFNDFGNGARWADHFGGDGGGVFEALQQRAVEAVEHGEMGFVGVFLALARAAAQHLLEEDARLDRAQENDDLQVGDVHAGGHEIDGDDDAGVLPVAELADALQRAIDRGR